MLGRLYLYIKGNPQSKVCTRKLYHVKAIYWCNVNSDIFRIYLERNFSKYLFIKTKKKNTKKKLRSDKSSTFTTLWANTADNTLMIFFLFFQENRFWHFMQIVSNRDNLHECHPVFWIIFQYVVCWNLYPERSELTILQGRTYHINTPPQKKLVAGYYGITLAVRVFSRPYTQMST